MRKLPALLLLSGLLLIAALSAVPPPPQRFGDRPLLPRADLLRVLFRGQLGLVSDYFWILTINRVGVASTPAEHRDIYYYADLTTDLDPGFGKVYTFAGVTIPLHLGREQYVNADESTRLLRKGARNVPSDPRIRFQLAYNLIFFHRQYREAADIIAQLAREPGSPPWYGGFATRLYAQSGDFDASRALTLAMRDDAEDEETRALYEQRVKEIEQEQMLRALDAAVQRFRAREGRLPATLQALVRAGDLPALPPDPLGGELYLDDAGRTHSTATKFRLEVITDVRTPTGERIVPKPREAPDAAPAP